MVFRPFIPGKQRFSLTVPWPPTGQAADISVPSLMHHRDDSLTSAHPPWSVDVTSESRIDTICGHLQETPQLVVQFTDSVMAGLPCRHI